MATKRKQKRREKEKRGGENGTMISQKEVGNFKQSGLFKHGIAKFYH